MPRIVFGIWIVGCALVALYFSGIWIVAARGGLMQLVLLFLVHATFCAVGYVVLLFIAWIFAPD
jgi:hypothetical protein